jgi:hypothetical protein
MEDTALFRKNSPKPNLEHIWLPPKTVFVAMSLLIGVVHVFFLYSKIIFIEQ